MGKSTTIARVDGVCTVCGKPWNRGTLIKQVQRGWGHAECPHPDISVPTQPGLGTAAARSTNSSRARKHDGRPKQFYWLVDARHAEPEDSSWARSTYRARVHKVDTNSDDPSMCVVRVLDGWASGREFEVAVASLEPIKRRQTNAEGTLTEEQYRRGYGARQRHAREEYKQKYPSQISDRMSSAKARHWARENAPDKEVSGPVKTGDPRRGSPGSLHGAGLGTSAQWGKGRRKTVIYRGKRDEDSEAKDNETK